MVRKGVYLTNAQVEFLKSKVDLTFAEHLRRAIDDYIGDLRALDSCRSMSKIINKEKDGRNINSPANR